jgi:acylphosphatase
VSVEDSRRIARKVVVHGRVQGVFFRDSCRREADEAGVAGWVRNEPDGSVAVLLEGAAPAVQKLVEWCHDGPPHASVERVDVEDADVSGATTFDVRG